MLQSDAYLVKRTVMRYVRMDRMLASWYLYRCVVSHAKRASNATRFINAGAAEKKQKINIAVLFVFIKRTSDTSWLSTAVRAGV
jgi:hypothetical protein